MLVRSSDGYFVGEYSRRLLGSQRLLRGNNVVALHRILQEVKQYGLGGLWAVLGLSSSKFWVSAFLIGMSVVHVLVLVTGALVKRRKSMTEEIPHVGGGINSSINATMEHEKSAVHV